jgi:hypothetical protein
MRENSDFATKINEIYVRLSGNPQRYVTGCCESESDGIIKGFGADCCKRRGGGLPFRLLIAMGLPYPHQLMVPFPYEVEGYRGCD